jgi:hypothetical protein
MHGLTGGSWKRSGHRATATGKNDLMGNHEAISGPETYRRPMPPRQLSTLLHLDCDVLEPGIVPTEYRVPGGLSLADLHSVCGVVAEHEVIGVEIAEFQSAWAPDGNEASPVELLDAMQPLLGR